MLSSPNDESPANIDAAREWREGPATFKKKVRKWGRELEAQVVHQILYMWVIPWK